MPKNKGKGGKNRRRGKNEGFVKRELVEKSDGQEYGQVIRMLGNGRLEAYCFDGKKRLCHIRGKMRKKVWVNQGDIILVSKREFQDDKADIVLRYNADEARLLKKRGPPPASIKIEDNPNEQMEEDIAFDFTAGDDEDSDSDSEDEILSQPQNRGMLPPSDSEDSDSDDVNLDEL